jgi:prevent-host-death family protein
MKSINITDFRANLLKYLKIAQHGEVLNITSNGQTLATITPPTEQKDDAKRKLKAIAKNAHIGDIISPINEEWDSMQ